jgi:O-methyltransferase involved in polyketide biosynthesis
VSKRGLFLVDKKAEEIWKNEGFELRGKSKSKWLAFYMGIRSAVFDEWLKLQLEEFDDAVVIHVGCGMDSRVLRVGCKNHKWYDVDFPEVIEERKTYYAESSNYQMIADDVRDCKWLTSIKESNSAIVVMEGVSMYLTVEEMQKLTDRLCAHFEKISLLVDCYTSFAARMSKHRNPINEVGVNEVYGIDTPQDYQNEKMRFIKEHSMIPKKYINELKGIERLIFANLYAGKLSKKLYRLFEYKK